MRQHVRQQDATNHNVCHSFRYSRCMSGASIQPGAVIGSTNANGTSVTDRAVDHGHIFHTILQAVGVDSLGEFEIAGRRFPVADPSRTPISELLT
ncbi:MAG: hypothetical protein ACKO2P_05905, partial [Planctomycetota bacterium]